MGKSYFKPAIFKFLRELEANNEKRWWEENKERYVAIVRDPALEFISDFAARLKNFSPHFVADARTVGGSLMRPYRDMRFSNDLTPYKTNVGIQFRHEAGKDVHAPGIYVHIEPGANFAGVGLWAPGTAVAHSIRRQINDHPDTWRNAAHTDAFESAWSLSNPEESLKRLPKQYDPEHPFAEDIKLKSFIASRSLSQKSVTSPDFCDDLSADLEKARPLAAFLCEAIALPF
ncbi:MAG: DUF2461 domain-containing protein [Acidimicrobiia bacterium]